LGKNGNEKLLHIQIELVVSEQIGRPRWLIFKKKPKLINVITMFQELWNGDCYGLKVYSEPKDFEGEMELKNKAIC
jgi:hypothetical protein